MLRVCNYKIGKRIGDGINLYIIYPITSIRENGLKIKLDTYVQAKQYG